MERQQWNFSQVIKNKMNNILISSTGKRVSLVRDFQKELKSVFPESKVFAADATPQLSAACIVADGWFKVPRLDNPTYIQELLKLCIENSIKLIVPTIDTELLLMTENKKLFADNDIHISISSVDFIQKCRDKRLIHQFFESKNIEVAEEYSKDNLQFPLFIKPSDGSRSIDTFYIETKDDLTDYHFSNDKFMFLEYLDHSKFVEYTCDLYYGRDNKLKCAVPRKRIEVRDGEVNKGVTEKNSLVKYINDNLSEIEGARGCLTFQFFKHIENDRIVGIEVNPRFGGGYPLSYLAGANFPKILIQEYLLGEDVDFYDGWEENLLMLRYDDEVLVHNYEE